MEKRLFRTRSKCPKPLQENMQRAMTQDFRVARCDSLPRDWTRTTSSPTMEKSAMAWNVNVVGSTGNVYCVCIDYRPSCSCPNFLKKQDICKHIFFVLRKVVKLPAASPIVFQKSYLTAELQAIFSCFQSNTSSATKLLSPPKVHRAYQSRKSSASSSTLCDDCGQALIISRKVIRCPRRGCGGVFHAECLSLLPNMSRLSLSAKPQKYKTFSTTCVLCDSEFDYDEGYVNVADVTGQSRVRDTSTYRPCPGYGGYHY